MIKIDFKGPKPADLIRLASAEVEKQISAKARSAALRHSGVSVRFKRKADGTLGSVEFERSEEAVTAAKATLQR